MPSPDPRPLRAPPRPTAIRTARLTTLILAAAIPACRATRPSHLPISNPGVAIVAVKSCALPASGPFWKSWAHHAWIDVKRPDQTTWERIESGGHFGIVHMDLSDQEARLDRRFGERAVRLLGWVEGDAARAAIAGIDGALAELAPLYADGYTMWPGPNSNTFVRELCADAPGLGFVFDPNAVGKDYSPWLGIGATASKTGLRVDTPILGAAVGLREGVELHVLQLTLGISLDPPGLSLPFLPQIPWGWFGSDDARLVPPPLAAATTVVLDDAICTGARHTVGTFRSAFTLVLARGDERGWARIDGTITAVPALPSARDVQLQFAVHEQDGVSSWGAEPRCEPNAAADPQRLQCMAAVVLLELQATDDGAVTATVRCFRSTQHEFEILSREAAAAGR